MATEFEKWIAIGKELGLLDGELRQFVVQQQAEDRDRRAQERELEKQKTEAERLEREKESQRKFELEKQKLEFKERQRAEETAEKRRLEEVAEKKRAEEAAEKRRLEEVEEKKRAEEAAEKRRLEELDEKRRQEMAAIEEKKRAEEKAEKRREELEERQEERKRLEEERRRKEAIEEREKETALEKLRLENQLEMKRLEIQNANAARASTSHSSSMTTDTVSSGYCRSVKLPMFDEEKDDLDAYLCRFERTCKMYNIPTRDWTIQLAKLLSGNALEIFERTSDEDLDDYDLFKSTLLKRFQQNERGYRKRFKRNNMLAGETPEQFAARLKRYLVKWRELSGLDATYEGMMTLMLKDQFFVTCSKELQVFLKEKGKMSLDEMLICAENYLDAHSGDTANKKKGEQSHKKDYKEKSGQSNKTEKSSEKSEGVKQNKDRGCYLCGSQSHKMANCNKKYDNASKTFNKSIQCYKCSAYGHKSSVCPNRNTHSAAAAVSTNRPIAEQPEVQNQRTVDDACNPCINNIDPNGQIHRCGQHDVNGDVQLNCGCKLPVIASALSKSGPWQRSLRIQNALPTQTGIVNGIPNIQIMRDTGCSTVVVRKDLVRSDQFTGEMEACVLIDGV